MDEHTRRVIDEIIEQGRRQARERKAQRLQDRAGPDYGGLFEPAHSSNDSELLPDWTELKVGEIADWIGQQNQRTPPVIFKLEFDAPRVLLDSYMPPAFRADGMRLQHRTDSGTVELRLPKPRGYAARAESASVEAALSLAGRIDEGRRFASAPFEATEVIRADVRSFLPEQELPIVGPGGRVTLYDMGDHIQADVIVRNRASAVKSRWREPPEVSEALRAKLAEQGPSRDIAKIYATLGYFELSKYEAQRWLRPVFLLFVERILVEDARVQWQSTLAEPATTSAEVPLDEGLGSWI
jgi:hypothetical protein